MQNHSNIYDLKLEDLVLLVSSLGESPYRAHQIWKGLYQQLWTIPDEFTMLPKNLRKNVFTNFVSGNNINDINQPFISLHPIKDFKSSDGKTTKTLFSSYSGDQIEAVLMKYSNRNSVCISTQAGCAMGCVFCATGQMGFHKHLTSGEIIEQVLFYARQLAFEQKYITNVVLMGMGEPFHNYEATMSAIERLNHSQGFNLGSRRFTISTVGLVHGIKRFTQAHSQVNLSISLHAADDTLRSQLLPINHKYPLDQLFSACQEYIQVSHRRLSFEWALIHGVNDTLTQAHFLVERLHPLRIKGSNLCHVNLIQLNPTKRFSGNSTTRKNAIAFQQILVQAGIPCTIRLRRGIDIQAGCGQLAGESCLSSDPAY